ncbi:MAG: hypothetical protein GY782_00930 [Gammaproteobacteria bacterium]|nr:hypothetical protein [Gammaproteobacteria bacterium]
MIAIWSFSHGRITLEYPGGYHWNGWADKNGISGRLVTDYAQVLWFTDRPAHKAGMWAMSHFIEEWSQGQTNFFVDHPNAVLSANTKTDGSGQNILKVLELSKPDYNAENDTLTYDVHVILDVNHNRNNEQLYHLEF